MTFCRFTMLYVLTLSCWKLHFCEGIYGGELATGKEVPWSILITSGIIELSMCSGTLISFDLVLTAAHCVQSKGVYHSALTLRAGVSLGSEVQQRKAAYCASHKLKSPTKWGEFDFAVVKADKAFHEAYGVSPVKITKENFIPGTECVMAGHGRRSPSTGGGFQVVMLKQIIVGCTTEARPCKKSDIIGPEPRDICPVPKEGCGVCKGDSGSGLVCNGSVYGVAHAISYRLNATKEDQNIAVDQQCGREVVLSIYVALWPYRDWIRKAIAKLETSSASSFDTRQRFSCWNKTSSTRLFYIVQPLLISTVLSSLLKA